MLHSRTLAASAAAAVGLASALAGCASPSLAAEARALLEAVRSTPGVESAALDYAKPVTLDSGKVRLRATMAPGAGADRAVDVVATVYEGYATTHVHEEGDLDVDLGDDRIHLRTFEPAADVADVRAQTAAVLEQAERGRLLVEVLADDVPADPGVRTTTVLRLPAGSTRADVLPAFDDLESTYGDDPDLGWEVRAADGSGLGGDGAFPSDLDRRRWRSLSALTVPGATVGVHYDTHVGDGGRVWSWVRVSVRGTPSLDDPRTYRRLLRMARGQVGLMRPYSDSVGYELLLDGRSVASADDDLGAFGRGAGKRFAAALLRSA